MTLRFHLDQEFLLRRGLQINNLRGEFFFRFSFNEFHKEKRTYKLADPFVLIRSLFTEPISSIHSLYLYTYKIYCIYQIG